MQLPVIKMLVTLCRILPRNAIWVLSGFLGCIASVVPGRSRKIFDINRRHVIGPNNLEVSLRRVYRNIISGILDFLNLSYRSDAEFLEAVDVRGLEHMRDALALGKGVLAITAHYSAWELIPRAVALGGFRVGIVTRKLSDKGTSRYFNSIRAMHCDVLIDRGSGISRLMRALRDNTAVGILIDQDTLGVEGDFVDFLGLPARTPTGPAQLAARFGIPVLTLHISRGTGGRYSLEIDKPLDPGDYGGPDGYLRLTADLSRRIEEWIAEDPEQWIWIHERWARRPGRAPGLR